VQCSHWSTVIDELVSYGADETCTHAIRLFAPGLLKVSVSRHQPLTISVLDIHFLGFYELPL
jgi:hypothetical protein